MKKYLIISIIFIVMIFGYMANAENNAVSITYKVYVDPGYGFYKVRDVTTLKNAPYDINNHTLTIKQGDAITWINDADTKVSLSLVSDQGLWNGGAALEKTYIFTYAGTYTFYLAEYPGKKQVVVVNPVEGYLTPSTPVPTIPPTITETTAMPTPTEISVTEVPTNIPTEIPTISPNSTNSSSNLTNSSTNSTNSSNVTNSTNSSNKDIPAKSSPTMIASIIVAIFSIYMTYMAGKNK